MTVEVGEESCSCRVVTPTGHQLGSRRSSLGGTVGLCRLWTLRAPSRPPARLLQRMHSGPTRWSMTLPYAATCLAIGMMCPASHRSPRMIGLPHR